VGFSRCREGRILLDNKRCKARVDKGKNVELALWS
jgi:hypothetical protein